jgi:hypothetical protein
LSRSTRVPLVPVLALLLGACTARPATPAAPTRVSAATPAAPTATAVVVMVASPTPAALPATATPAPALALSPTPVLLVEPSAAPEADLTRISALGAVEFAVTPLNLAAEGARTLDFDVSLNTHSVDVSWDLAALSTLSTDTGRSVAGLSWPVGGGHHYDGTLTFPAEAGDGRPLLAGATRLTLLIRDTDVPERIFEWAVGD